MNMTRTSFFKFYGNGIAKTLFLVAFMLCMQTRQNIMQAYTYIEKGNFAHHPPFSVGEDS